MKKNGAIDYNDLEKADLIIDCLYKHNPLGGNLGGNPLYPLLKVRNQGGFRPKVAVKGGVNTYNLHYIVLVITEYNPDWPDEVDKEQGLLVYYGDQRRPGHALLDTNFKGNYLLEATFERLHSNRRDEIPPIFVFSQENKDVRFTGLVVPGYKDITMEDDLVAVWAMEKNQRYQNYKAIFTILDVNEISRNWIDDIMRGNTLTSPYIPTNYKKWVDTGVYTPLKAHPVRKFRNPEEQLPKVGSIDDKLVSIILDYFENGYAFEACAIALCKMLDKNIMSISGTRRTRDGGKDGIGKYRIGDKWLFTEVDFAVEAKFKQEYSSQVGPKDVSRLVARLRYRQFGILVTTSCISLQTYQEIIEDELPIIVISAIDIANILKRNKLGRPKDLKYWLRKNFSRK
ncbi:restriction endonuclease [Turicibacter sanguinis]|uniref:restriction endonuclease n=1 Tax=Turicibacter sanguinis TaxID=154288 RepID=UPI00232ADA83|nr:restriction endonuclease [Turicibacter sanguinis]MDB8562385.1 restriction endonuclease [Turicibacter sanguinis]